MIFWISNSFNIYTVNTCFPTANSTLQFFVSIMMKFTTDFDILNIFWYSIIYVLFILFISLGFTAYQPL